MIYVENTPNNLGVAIYGDYKDFENLYDSLHNIVGDQDSNPYYEGSRLRVLGLCYDIRHAMQGDREYEFVSNGLDNEIMKYRDFIAPKNNIYLKINTLWPEILFIQMVLNELIIIYAKVQSREYFDILQDNKNVWDESIANVRMLQAAIYKCIKETITEGQFKRMPRMMISKYSRFSSYITQYLDYLNIKFMEMDKEERLKNISIMTKRINEQGKKYKEMERDIHEAAKKYKCSIDNIRLNMAYPEDFEW